MRSQRQMLRDAIEGQGAPCLVLHCDAPQQTVEQWLVERQQQGTDVSDAGIDVMRHQLQSMEPLTDEEKRLSLSIDTSSEDAMSGIAEQLRQRL